MMVMSTKTYVVTYLLCGLYLSVVGMSFLMEMKIIIFVMRLKRELNVVGDMLLLFKMA